MLAHGEPATNGTVAFHLGIKDQNGVSTGFMEYQTKVDGAGHFVFAQVPPGQHRLMEVLEISCSPCGPNGKGWTSQLLTNVIVLPGATTTIAVNGVGQFVLR